MPLDSTLERNLTGYVETHRDRLLEIVRDLVRIPSENTPPVGAEDACQQSRIPGMLLEFDEFLI